ncbi:hypothetical protein HHK36_030623 [Tetracentron sinense]|uniref:Uncharacterized protein n=1 Tax=Tetracentron sinense TaxID=13715 RepID=A0A835D1Q7_TETSI|nr:hypothetical protein HHK36_030623 [Tetracentron sinense]
MQKIASVISAESMNSPTQFATSRRMDLYEPVHQISMWRDTFNGNSSLNTGASTTIKMDTKLDKSEGTSRGTLGPSKRYNHGAAKPVDKVKRLCHRGLVASLQLN